MTACSRQPGKRGLWRPQHPWGAGSRGRNAVLVESGASVRSPGQTGGAGDPGSRRRAAEERPGHALRTQWGGLCPVVLDSKVPEIWPLDSVRVSAQRDL